MLLIHTVATVVVISLLCRCQVYLHLCPTSSDSTDFIAVKVLFFAKLHQVREIAMTTVVEIYRHVGDKVRQDLSRKDLPRSKYWPLLLCKVLQIIPEYVV